jgi:hypothetical protein
MKTLANKWFRLVVGFAGGALVCLSSPVFAKSIELHYMAYMGTAEAGEIRLSIDVTGAEYVVQGEAMSLGLMELIKALRARFTAKGRVSGGSPQPTSYEYHHRDNSKERLVTVANGEVTYRKNGEQRPNQPVQPGIDLVSALWMSPPCTDLGNVHTGRSLYVFSLTEGSGDRCTFKVVSDDETFEVAIQYGNRAGLRVPVSISSTGFFAGEVRLIE